MSDFDVIGQASTTALALGPVSVVAWVLSVLLLSIRFTVAMAMSPALDSYGLPASIRLVIVFVLAALVQSAQASPLAAMPLQTPEQLIRPAAAEVFLGMLLGLGVHVVLAAFAIAGRILDVQI